MVVDTGGYNQNVPLLPQHRLLFERDFISSQLRKWKIHGFSCRIYHPAWTLLSVQRIFREENAGEIETCGEIMGNLGQNRGLKTDGVP